MVNGIRLIFLRDVWPIMDDRIFRLVLILGLATRTSNRTAEGDTITVVRATV